MYKSTHHRYGKGRFVFIPLMIITALLVFGYIVMLLWNAILPEVTPVSKLTFWQAVGLLILSRILFGGFRFGGKHHKARAAWRKKWMSMSEEDRAHFKQEWRERCKSKGRDEKLENDHSS